MMALGADLMQSVSPPQRKKLRAQGASLICVFKTALGGVVGLIRSFPETTRQEKFTLVFFNAA
jgi:hypothetical protein